MTTDTIGGTTSYGGSFVGYVFAYKITASASGALETLGINDYSAAGNVRRAIYSHNAVSNKPASLLGETGSIAAASGWQDTAPGDLPAIVAGTVYWIAFAEDSNSNNPYYAAASGRRSYYSKTYGAFDATWSATSTQQDAAAVLNMRMTYSPIVVPTVTTEAATGLGLD